MKIILIILGLGLIAINLVGIKKNKGVEKKNNDFQDLLEKKENNIEDYKVEMGKLRRELSETIVDLQREIYNLRDEIEILKGKESVHIIKNSEERVEEDDNNLKIEDSPKTTVRKVNELLRKNKSDDEICSSLSIGKGELLLIKSLHKY